MTGMSHQCLGMINRLQIWGSWRQLCQLRTWIDTLREVNLSQLGGYVKELRS